MTPPEPKRMWQPVAPDTHPEGRVLHPRLDGSYLELVRGQGLWVEDDTGRTYLDSVAGVGVMALGYGRADLVAAAQHQAEILPYSHSMRFRNAPQEELAERLRELTPPGLDWSFFCSGGSEALDSAVKLIRLYWLERREPSRWKIIGRRPSFHGNTLMGLAVGDHPVRRAPYGPLLIEMAKLPAPWIFHCDRHGPEGPWCPTCSGEALEELIVAEGPESVAAFIAEPIVGAAAPGVTPPAGYYETIRQICDRHGVLLVVDEVMTGLGRTGRDWGIQHWDVVPDVMLTAKGIGSGYASIAAVVAHDQVIEVLRSGSGTFEHNFTMAGNPLACAVSCAVLDAYRNEGIREHVEQVAPTLREGLLQLRRHCSIVGDVRGLGLHLGLELTQPGTNRPLPANLRAAASLDLLAREEGLLIYPCSGIVDGQLGDAVLLLPALVITEEECREIVNRLGRALERLEAQVLPRLS
jgi:hypothetical protein